MTDRQKFDGVRLAILNNRWEGIARKMTNTLLRTGRSGVLNTARDFSCCIVTADDKLLATAESIPIHVLYGPDMMARAMKELHPDFKPGDAFLHNSPYHGCSHPADHTILVPVFDEAQTHRYTVVVKAHQADIGNSLPTTYMGNARDVYEEGALIFPAVRVQEHGRDVDDIIRMCKLRIRVPDQWWGDYIAMIGSARIGEREVKALAGEVGWDTLHAYEDDWFDYSEDRMVEAIRKLPSGRMERTSTHDPLPSTPEDGITIKVKVEVDAEQAMIDIDLRDNMDALECGLNVSEACTRTAALIGVFNSLDASVPRNAGSFRRVTMQLKENGVVGIPRHPFSCSVATTNVADRVTNPVQCAIAELAAGAGQAEAGALLPGTTAVISGRDPRTGKDFVNQLFVVHTAGAGSPSEDAWLTIAHSGNAGMLYIDSVEVSEQQYPIRIWQKRLVADTEGAGTYIGAPSAMAEFGPIDCRMAINYVADGCINVARGVRGGGEGGACRQYRRGADGHEEPLPNCTSDWLEPGQTLVSYTPGGGGYGSPLQRDPQRVARDVSEGWISRTRAHGIYGVVLADDGCVDERATRQRRAELSAARADAG